MLLYGLSKHQFKILLELLAAVEINRHTKKPDIFLRELYGSKIRFLLHF